MDFDDLYPICGIGHPNYNDYNGCRKSYKRTKQSSGKLFEISHRKGPKRCQQFERTSEKCFPFTDWHAKIAYSIMDVLLKFQTYYSTRYETC